ncbi:PP2C family protein-serine/threonine phosphatase [Streptomyces sp. NRRL B-24484]|uniref:PP2C family protein-serine/threonine phosphatase n=1 Tax=Streptomyces sp. NRRL B-24484 TaxID=1463833 RepID=UPI0004C02706|nr:SpoIIE family protein phosphatase [Streptomyces sp. NRRL B-24484]
MPATGDGRVSAAAARIGAADAGDTARRAGTGTSTPTTSAAGLTGAGRPVPQRAKAAAETAAPGRTARPDGAREPAPIPHPRTTSPERGEPSDEAPYRLLVIADGDTEDLSLIESLVAESGARVDLHRAEGIDEAAALLAPLPMAVRRSRPRPVDFNCVLLDLAAPVHGGHAIGEHFPSDGLDGLRELRRRAPHVALVVLTDAAGAELGAAAVAAGAQDFLVKRETDGPLLARALRYAVERKRADESQRRLVEAELRGQENARLQRHLLPTPLLDGAGLAFTRRYRPGRRRALLGGDFYDAVRTDDGTVHVVIGDVCGHGPDEAALGVALRIAWRTLVFAGLTGQELLTTLQHVLEHERRSDEIFATLCMLVLVPGADASGAAPADGRDPDGTAPGGALPADSSDALPVETARLFLAGHPAPLLLGPDGPPRLLPADQAGPALGLLPCDDGLAAWPAVELDLQPGWSLLLYTDGLVEGRVGAGSRRLGQDGLIELIADHHATGLTRGRLVDSALAEVEELNGGSLTDDVAVLLLERNPVPALMG